MTEKTVGFERRQPQSEGLLESPRQIERPFFDAFSTVTALTKTLTKPNEAVDLFSSSKLQLERELKARLDELGSERTTGGSSNAIAIYHSLLALIHWLYPNYELYDRMKNASAMYQQAKEASKYSETPFSESYVLSLFIQLRVLPFLIMSKRPLENQLSKVQSKAQLLILTLDSMVDRNADPESKSADTREAVSPLESYNIDKFRGLLHEALGFSYWQLKRDSETALKHLEKSVAMLVERSGKLFKDSDSSDPYQWNPSSHSRKFGKSSDEEKSFYNAFLSVAFWDQGHCHEGLAENVEGDESTRLIKKARADYERSYIIAKKTRWDNYKGLSAYMIASTFELESQQETEKKKIVKLLKRAITTGEEALHWLSRWSVYDSDFLAGSWIAMYYGRLADYSEPRLKRSYMLHSLKLTRRAEDLITKHESKMGGKLLSASRIGDIYLRNSSYYRQIALNERSASTGNKPLSTQKGGTGKNFALNSLKKSLDYAVRSRGYYKEDRSPKKTMESCKLATKVCYDLLKTDFQEDERKGFLAIAKKACRDAGSIAKKNDWNEAVAESNWDSALILDVEGRYAESAKHYLEAHDSYEKAKANSEQGGRVYGDYAEYMLGWNKVELAKLAHASSKFERASELYNSAASLISKTKEWSRVSTLFMAESLIEKAEDVALREEGAGNAIGLFDQAISNLSRFAEKSKDESSSDLSPLAKQLTTFCRARMILEKSKDAYRMGDYERSISGLANAEEMFTDLASISATSDPLRSNELLSMSSLCMALAAFQKAQLKGDEELYLEARKIFGKAAEESKSKTLRPLLMGLASFASFLFYSNQVEESLDTKLDFQQLDECHKALQNAESNFRKLGNKSFLNMLKASKHILDATIKMSAAEREVDRIEVKAKLYAEAQRSLSLASKYYKVMGSSKRLKEALKMISAVRNHQRLIPLAHDIIAEVASSQIIYAAIASSPVMEQSPYTDSSQGSGASYVSLDCELEKAYSQTGERTQISFSISNLGREGITLVNIDEPLPEGFEIVECPIGSLSGQTLKLNLKLGAGASKAFTMSYIPRSSGEFIWHPSLIFLDATRSFKIAKSRITRAVVESSDKEDFAELLRLKTGLEAELSDLKLRNADLEERAKTDSHVEAELSRHQDETFALKEKISRIEEKFLRTKNEYKSLVAEREKLQTDLESVSMRAEDSSESRGLESSDEYTSLKAEESLLEARISRRRLLLEQAQLL